MVVLLLNLSHRLCFRFFFLRIEGAGAGLGNRAVLALGLKVFHYWIRSLCRSRGKLMRSPSAYHGF